jgi:exopolyphosphatase / guanosine-5'-triphosphate,3'-diphosphate pyrophosphatase
MSPRRSAFIDIGTNAILCLIVDIRDTGRFRVLDDLADIARLGEGVDRTGRISLGGEQRALAVLEHYRDYCRNLGVEEIIAVGTSALRDAANSAEVRARWRDRLGFDVRVISGNEEAAYSFLAVQRGLSCAAQELLVIDIGGGSTEFVVGSAGAAPDFRVSTQAGSVRQTERHLQEDPPSDEDMAKLQAAIRSILDDAIPPQTRDATTKGIAVAGTATSLAAIDQQLDPYDPEKVDGYGLLIEACDRMLGELAALPLDERKRVTGLHPDRAPTIIAGAAILVESMRLFGLGSVEVSEADILHGAALDLAAK